MSEPGILPNPIPFGKYYLLERINVGGMAEVYKAKAFGEEGFERILAVKKILASIAEDEAFINMFIDEAKITGKLNHPNICQAFDLGKVDGSFFIAMEYIAGKDLKTIFERSRRLGDKVSIPRVCFEMMKICEGLSHAHDKCDAQGTPIEIVHRDISPQNILLSYEGEVKIIDFGIAKASGKTSQTQVGILKGKFSYMSPEQVRGLHVDNRSDIFSVGILMYELLTLERLFLGESDFDTLEKIRKVEMSPPSLYNPHIPAELEKIVLKTLSKSPDERFQSASDLAEALEKFMRSQGYYYTNKDLASYMKEAFSADIEFENKKFEYYKSLNLSPISAGHEEASTPAIRSSRGLSWGEEEMETQIFDRDDENADELIISESAQPTVEFERWTDKDIAFDENPSTVRTIQATEQMSAVSSRSISKTTVPPPAKKQNLKAIWLSAFVVLLAGLFAFFIWRQMSKATLTIATQPANVEVWINGDKIYTGNTPHELSIPSGLTKLELRKKGFQSFKQEIDAQKGTGYNLTQTLIALNDETPSENKQPSTVIVNTNPVGATLEINGKKYEKQTPFSADIGKGPYKIKISKAGFLDEERTLDSLDATNMNFRLKPAQLSLRITSKPKRASVSIYEEAKTKALHRGKTPLNIPDLDARKKYRVVVKKSKFETWEDVFEPGFDKENELIAKLGTKSDTRDDVLAVDNSRIEREKKRQEILRAERERKSKEKEKKKKDEKRKADEKPVVQGVGFLYIQSNPVARVYIDGKDTGRYTPLLKFKLSAGKKHRIKLVNAEFGLSKTYYVNVQPGKKKKIVNK